MEICDEEKEKIDFPWNPNYLTWTVSFCKGNQLYKQALFEANSVTFKLNEWKTTFIPLNMQNLPTNLSVFNFHSVLSVRTNQINQDISLCYSFGSSSVLSLSLEVVIVFYPKQRRFSHLQNVCSFPIWSDTTCCSAYYSCVAGAALVCFNAVWLPQRLLI